LQDHSARNHYNDLARHAGLDDADSLPDAIHELLIKAGLSTRLADLDVDPATFPALAEQAAQQWTARFNPRRITATDFASLYSLAYGGMDA